MKLSIGHRLFAAVLLAILAVAATGIALMRQNLMASFSAYAVEIELDRLEQLSQNITQQYASKAGWTFLPPDAGARHAWIPNELMRLQSQRIPLPPAPPAPPPPPALPGQTVLPPLPPPRIQQTAEVDLLSLQNRIALMDAGGRYLAGRRLGGEALARRELRVDGRTIGYLAVVQASRPSDAMASAFLERIGDSLLLIVAISVALSALAAMLLAAHFRKPIQKLADGARALADGRYDTRLEDRRSDELGELAQRFNQMAEKLGQMEAARRQWVADTSHELRTPLSVLRAQLEAIQDGVRGASPDHLAAMLRQVLALNKLIDELYALAQADIGQLDLRLQTVDAWQLATEAADAFRHKFDAAGLTLEIGSAPGAARVAADPDRLRQVLSNLFENSVRYTSAPGQVSLRASVDGGMLALVIEDSAPGVAPDALAQLGQRFYRVEGSRSRDFGGAGLGLALCMRIVEAHGGSMRFDGAPLGGLRVTLRLPLARA